MSAPALALPATTRIALVVHPERRDQFAAVQEACDFFRGDPRSECETVGDGHDPERVRALVESSQADVVVAAGGDGTVAAVAAGLLEVPTARRPDLAILPLGTANNVARSFGLPSVRVHGRDAVEKTLTSIYSGRAETLTTGDANGSPFVGSFALGMDGAILRRRNELRSRLHLGKGLGGYPLYLASCAIETLAHRTTDVAIDADGDHFEGAAYNILITSCPIYAGEFRFADANGIRAGHLALHTFESRGQFLRGYVGAWRRHVHFERGERIFRPESTQECTTIRIRLPREVPAQLDGEQAALREEWTIRVQPSAIRLRLP